MIGVAGMGWVSWQGYGKGPVRHIDDMPQRRLPDIPGSVLFDSPDRQFARMDAYSRIGLAAAVFAMKDAGFGKSDNRNMGIVAVTRYGCLRSDADYFKTVLDRRGITASPALFAYTLPTSLIGVIAIRLGITGPGFVIQQDTLSGLAGLELAVDILESNEADTLLVGHCDIGPPDFIQTGEPAPDLPALFFVLQKDDSLKSGYGVLSATAQGMSFRNRVISGHIDLMESFPSHPDGMPWNG